MEPNLVTESRLLPILDALQRREPLFHRPEFGTTRRDFAVMIEPGYWEVGASGRRYSRDHVLDVLEERHRQPFEDAWETHGFHCQELAPALYLLTYTLHQGARVTRRATLWRNTAEAWKAVYHQGTLVKD